MHSVANLPLLPPLEPQGIDLDLDRLGASTPDEGQPEQQPTLNLSSIWGSPCSREARDAGWDGQDAQV